MTPILRKYTFNSEATPKRLVKKLVEQKVCAVSVGIPYEGLSYVGIDNYKGMYDMVDHLVKEHHIKNPAFLAGARDNADSNERLIATREALAKNGIELKDENIRYTNWEYLTSMRYAMEYCKRPDLMPEFKNIPFLSVYFVRGSFQACFIGTVSHTANVVSFVFVGSLNRLFRLEVRVGHFVRQSVCAHYMFSAEHCDVHDIRKNIVVRFKRFHNAVFLLHHNYCKKRLL